MKLRAIAAAGGICALALAFGATPAFAAGMNNVVTAVTHTNHHPDTLNITPELRATPSCTVGSSGGTVWSYDKLSFRFTVVPLGTNTYTVTITAHGSFHAFANHTTGACTTFNGSVDGTLNYVVQSETGPDSANLPSQEPGTVSQGDMVKQLLGTTATIVGGGTYSYIYRLITGQKFVTAS